MLANSIADRKMKETAQLVVSTSAVQSPKLRGSLLRRPGRRAPIHSADSHNTNAFHPTVIAWCDCPAFADDHLDRCVSPNRTRKPANCSDTADSDGQTR